MSCADPCLPHLLQAVQPSVHTQAPGTASASPASSGSSVLVISIADVPEGTPLGKGAGGTVSKVHIRGLSGGEAVAVKLHHVSVWHTGFKGASGLGTGKCV